jgi:hypothetical protein
MHESRRKLAEKATEVDALRNSVSWRITAPLRRLRSTFRPRPPLPDDRDRPPPYEKPSGADA